jgi:hypothetical protein
MTREEMSSSMSPGSGYCKPPSCQKAELRKRSPVPVTFILTALLLAQRDLPTYSEAVVLNDGRNTRYKVPNNSTKMLSKMPPIKASELVILRSSTHRAVILFLL